MLEPPTLTSIALPKPLGKLTMSVKSEAFVVSYVKPFENGGSTQHPEAHREIPSVVKTQLTEPSVLTITLSGISGRSIVPGSSKSVTVTLKSATPNSDGT